MGLYACDADLQSRRGIQKKEGADIHCHSDVGHAMARSITFFNTFIVFLILHASAFKWN
jgi:hypothetical protein